MMQIEKRFNSLLSYNTPLANGKLMTHYANLNEDEVNHVTIDDSSYIRTGKDGENIDLLGKFGGKKQILKDTSSLRILNNNPLPQLVTQMKQMAKKENKVVLTVNIHAPQQLPKPTSTSYPMVSNNCTHNIYGLYGTCGMVRNPDDLELKANSKRQEYSALTNKDIVCETCLREKYGAKSNNFDGSKNYLCTSK